MSIVRITIQDVWGMPKKRGGSLRSPNVYHLCWVENGQICNWYSRASFVDVMHMATMTADRAKIRRMTHG